MNKSEVSAGIKALTIAQAQDLSFIDVSGKRLVVVKLIDGAGYSGSLSDLSTGFRSLNLSDQNWVINDVTSASISAGGRDDCP